MKLFATRSVTVPDVEADEPDFPLPIADPSIRPMHRQCVLKGCSYRNPFLFATGWLLAVIFLGTAVAIGFYGVSAQEALLRENALLIEALRERTVAPSVAPSPAPPRVETPEPTSVPAPSPAKAPALPRRRVAPPKPPQEYTVPDEEKWWNRP